MKTVYTTLPVYNTQNKQYFTRASLGNENLSVPTMSLPYRFPSMQWNVEDDNTGEILMVDMCDKNGMIIPDTALNLTNISYDTYVTTADSLDLTASAVATGWIAGPLTIAIGDYYIVSFNAILTGDVPQIIMISGGLEVSNYVEVISGQNMIYLRATEYISNAYITIRNTTTTDLYLTNIKVKKDWTSNMNLGPDMPDRNMVMDGNYYHDDTTYPYDSLVQVFATRTATIQKTTTTDFQAVIFHDSKIRDEGVVKGEKVRLYCYFHLVGGSFPKLALRKYDGASRDILSNIVTLQEGYNMIVLEVNQDFDDDTRVFLYNESSDTTHYEIQVLFMHRSSIPSLYSSTMGSYFQYKGGALATFLDDGDYYLRFKTLTGFIYWSEWFRVGCIYESIITDWTNDGYNVLTTSGADITEAIELGASGIAKSNIFSCFNGERFTVIINLTLQPGLAPTFNLIDLDNYIIYSKTLYDGVNVLTFASTYACDAYFYLENITPITWSAEILSFRTWSEKYLQFIFSNGCNIGNLLYEDDFIQTLFLESEPMESAFPYTEKGQENGDGRFIPTFRRQDKTYLIETLLLPDFMIDVLHRLKMHNTILLVDNEGVIWEVKNIDVDHDWQFEDKYYALARITVDLGEEAVITGCCPSVSIVIPGVPEGYPGGEPEGEVDCYDTLDDSVYLYDSDCLV